MLLVASASLEPVPELQRTELQPTGLQAAAEILRYESDWESWFAWRPVRLYMTGQFAWLRHIHRRNVSRSGISTCDYTDRPDEFTTPGLDGEPNQAAAREL